MSRNPFDDDYRGSSASSTMPVKSYSTMGHGNAESDADYYEREIEKYMQESLESTERSRRHLENSEKTGAATAQELLEQREKLERTEKNLDEIHRTTQMTQRNLNSLKSFFGGFFKNKLSKKPQEPNESAVVSVLQFRCRDKT
uniref:t-SNARE coiled-coil homology domain-containing protein n=1 Tax=Caenorhabditis japonica TaxID=281687 RepID=A0A8R1EIX9_CAEJA